MNLGMNLLGCGQTNTAILAAMNFGGNLLEWVQTNAASLAAVIVIVFGIKFWLSKETGKFVGALIILAVCITFIIEPTMIMNFMTGVVKKVLGGK